MIFRSFRKRNSSQKNTNTVYSEYSYSGIVPKERALNFFFDTSHLLQIKIKVQFKCPIFNYLAITLRFIVFMLCFIFRVYDRSDGKYGISERTQLKVISDYLTFCKLVY